MGEAYKQEGYCVYGSKQLEMPPASLSPSTYVSGKHLGRNLPQAQCGFFLESFWHHKTVFY